MLVALEILALALLKKTLLRDPSLKPIPQSDIHPLLKYLSTVVTKVMCFLDHPDAVTIVLLRDLESSKVKGTVSMHLSAWLL